VTQPLSRRTLLRGLGGIALSLPMLEIMSSPRTAHADESAADESAKPPRRFLVWSTPNGTVTDAWRPKPGANEKDFTLSPILSPLAALKNDMVVVQHLKGCSYGHHWISSLTGRPARDIGYPNLYATGISVDQQIANAIGTGTPIPSLQLGVQMRGDRDTAGCVSWAGADRPLPAENNPYLVFNKLFAGGASVTNESAEKLRAQLARKRSILDSVLQQQAALQKKLGTADKRVVDAHFQSIRDLETRLVALEASRGRCTAPAIPQDPSKPGETPVWDQDDNVPMVIDLFRRLIVAAFACDITRVITINMSNSGGAYRMHRWIPGIDHNIDWHGHSHNVEVGNPSGLTAIQTYYYAELAKLASELKATTEADGKSVLYNSLILSNNEYGSNGRVDYIPKDGGTLNFTHETKLMPYVLLGQAGGKIETGRNIVAGGPITWLGEGPPHTQLLVSMLNAMGLPDTTFGAPDQQKGPLPGLVA
jgi:hypothetical protein